ncbi:UDP-glucosyltransferase 29-like [Magnolia sinica]|uniref:UDP-glucosyltransferase 29-like n=1 Tax=Magnolia sinica TaxID=86752 RepID=UPI002659DB05|nr:UDP-glucosyltransferase 29-like [Magnolia sinica]
MEPKGKTLHVLMLPCLAHGHISPFLELAKRLSRRNFLIHLCSTSTNLSSIKEHLNEKTVPSIQLVQLHLPTLPNLPPQCHSTKSLPPHLMRTLKMAFDHCKPSLSQIISTINPDLIIYDFIQPWDPEAASHLNIPVVLFFSTSAAAISFIMTLNDDDEFPFPAIHMSDHEEQGMAHMLKSVANGVSNKERLDWCMDRSSDFILIKTFGKIESKYIDYLSLLARKEIVPVGPRVQWTPHLAHQCKFKEWLGNKEISSIVFVSFGSEYFMSKKERDEVAHGLELSKVNFIWVLRFYEGEKMGVEEALPRGFLERVGSRGMVVERWAPQGRILEHTSIGGFVTHCGWSTVMEGMWFGVPLIAMPLHLDQPLNARLVVEIGVAVEVERGGDGVFEREEVARSIIEVVVGKEGEGVKRNAKEMGEMMRKKRDDEEIDLVMEKFMGLCRNDSKSLGSFLQ